MKNKSAVKSNLLLALISAVVLFLLSYLRIIVPSAALSFLVAFAKGFVVMLIVAFLYYRCFAKTSPKTVHIIIFCAVGALLMACANRMIMRSPFIMTGRFLKVLGLPLRAMRHSINVLGLIVNFICAFVGFTLIDTTSKGGFAVHSIKNSDKLLEQILSELMLQLEQPKYATMCSADELNVTNDGEMYTITGYVEDNGTKKFFRATAKCVQNNWIVIDAKL